MAQPQPQVPSRTFSPTQQMSPSPVPHAASFPGQPPSKKPRLSPAPSQQGLAQPGGSLFSPVPLNGANSITSPATPGTPNSLVSPTATPSSSLPAASQLPLPFPSSSTPSATASPISAPNSLPGSFNNVSYANGNSGTNGNANGSSTPKLQLPATSPAAQVFSPKAVQTPTPPTPTGPLTPSGPPLPHIAPASSAAPTATNVFTPMGPSPAVQTPTGVMGPPSKPADRPTKEYQYDVDDSLAGTGIDLRQEEQFQADYFAGSYRPEARTGFPANTPGRKSSFYGSLSANQPAETTDEADQKRAEVEIAKQKWTESARELATSRGNALHNRFLEFGALHARTQKIAHEYGINLILDPKTAPSTSVRMRQDAEFPKPRVTVKTETGPDGVAFVSTTGTFLPEDTYLADQLALLSLATKHRLRELIEDANKVATTRQLTSHGVVPEEWLDAAAPLPSAANVDLPKDGEEGAGGSSTNPLKRPREADDAETPAEIAKKISSANTLVQSLRAVGKTERSIEEQRLLKRQKREGKKTDQAPGTPATRPGTPGTPGSVAPEPDKAPTKKELKKSAAAKVAEQNDTLSANRTSMAFLGGRKKQYSWLSGGSGPSTPKRGLGGSGGLGGGGAGGGPGGGASTPGATPGRKPGEPVMLTGEGRTKWGSWREDGIKGKDIQLRDLVVVLEADGREIVALQSAYNKLDGMPPAAQPPKPATG